MNGDSRDVLVLDANGQAGLAIVRSLGRRGVSVTAGSSGERSLGGLSRYSDAEYTHPDPTEDAGRFVEHLREHLEDGDYFTVVPVRDRTTVVLSREKPSLEATGTAVAAEDWDVFERAYDKGQLFELAEPLSVPIPETYAPATPGEVEEIAHEVPYPAVVKPRSKTTWDGAGRCHYTRIGDDNYVHSPADLVATYRELLEDNPFLVEQDHLPLVQEYVHGTTTTTVVLAEDGDVGTYFQEERVRTHPSSGGNSALLRPLDAPKMRSYAADVVDALEWTGPAMVEFLRTPDGAYALVEVNGRYWGSVPFAVACGVDFPWLHYRQLRGDPPAPQPAYRTDVLQHRLLNEDLKWLAEQLERGDIGAVAEFLRTCRDARQTFVSRDDPLPTLAAPWRTATLAARGAARHLSHAAPDRPELARRTLPGLVAELTDVTADDGLDEERE